VRLELVAPPEPVVARGSPERLTQVFENLLDNAVSFSPPAGTVRIDVGRRDGSAVAAIADAGPGIPPGAEDRIFGRFYTDRPGGDKAEAGHTGLGLALVKAIVEGYGGEVTGATRPEGGACFTVRLPIQ